MVLRSKGSFAASATASLMLVACFSEPPEVGESPDDTGTSNASDSPTASGSSIDPTSTTSGPGSEATSGSATSGSGTSAATGPQTTAMDASATSDTEVGTSGADTTGDPLGPCNGLDSGCAGAEFCEGFEGFGWGALSDPWAEVPGFSGTWSESVDPVACGQSALATRVTSGNQHGVLGISVPLEGGAMASPHSFGGQILVESECATPGAPPVRVLVLQYLIGGTQRHTVEIWARHGELELRQTGQPPAVIATPSILGKWISVSVDVTPGDSAVMHADNEQVMSAAPVASEFALWDRAQLLAGPIWSSKAAPTDCSIYFDDVAFSRPED